MRPPPLSSSARDHSSHTPTSPSEKEYRGSQPRLRARELSTITAGISPALAGPCSTCRSAPLTRRTCSTTSSTDSDDAGADHGRAGPLLARQRKPDRGDDVGHVHVVAHLEAVAVDLERRAEPDRAHQPRDDAVLRLHPGPVHVRQPQARTAEPVRRGVRGHQHLAGGLRRAVRGQRAQRRVLGDRAVAHRADDGVRRGKRERLERPPARAASSSSAVPCTLVRNARSG